MAISGQALNKAHCDDLELDRNSTQRLFAGFPSQGHSNFCHLLVCPVLVRVYSSRFLFAGGFDFLQVFLALVYEIG